MGVVPPPKTTLRNWQHAVEALYPESFEVLKEVCESEQPEVEAAAVTLSYLTRKEFGEFSALQQGLCIRHLSRQVRSSFCCWHSDIGVPHTFLSFRVSKVSVGGRNSCDVGFLCVLLCYYILSCLSQYTALGEQKKANRARSAAMIVLC